MICPSECWTYAIKPVQPHMTAGFAHPRGQLQLAIEIVIKYPILPENFRCVGIKPQPYPDRKPLGVGIRRSWIESDPAAMRQPRLHPAMRVGAADQLRTADGIVNPALKTRHYAGGD